MKKLKQFVDRNRTYQHHDTSTHRWVKVPGGKPVLVRREASK